MFYRFAATTIVLFWLTMTALLVRKELGPRDTSLREIPLAHVERTMFAHQQASDLQIYSEKLPVGHLRIQPRIRQEDGQRLVDFTGNLQLFAGTLALAMPDLPKERVAWTGELEFDQHLEMQRAKIAFSLKDLPSANVDILIEPAEHRVTLRSQGGAQPIAREYSLDENGVNKWLRDLGIDPALLKGFPGGSHSAPPVFKALQSTLDVHGEKIETWLISAEQGEQTLIEMHISQLGQILQVKTFAGYSAAPDDLSP